VAAGVAALERPTWRNQLAFVALAVLATLARIQFAVLPVVYLAAVLALGLSERRIRAVLREQLPLLVAFTVPVGLVAVAVARGLGVYSGLLGVSVHPLGIARWSSLDAMGLLYASGWALVPGAIVGLILAAARPRSRAEAAFAWTTAFLVPGLLLPAALVQADAPGAGQIQERYVFYLVPLVALAFALYASRGWPHRTALLLLAAGFVAVSARLPLAGYAADPSNNSGSPVLHFVYWLEQQLGQPWLGSIAVAGVAALVSALTIACSFRPRAGTLVALLLAACFCVTVTVGAMRFELRNSFAARFNFLPETPTWVDRQGLDHVALLQSYGGDKTDAFDQLFWNRSIDRALLLPGAAPFERSLAEAVHIGSDGTLLSATKAIDQPLLVDDSASTVRLRGARPVAVGPTHTLWRPTGWPRLSLYLLGRYSNGWLADSGKIMLWPDSSQGGLAGRLSFVAAAPAAADPTTLTFSGSGSAGETVKLRPGVPEKITLPVCSAGPWGALFRSSSFGFVGGRPASVRTTVPQYVPDASVCPARPNSAY
jgi:hypothetical protein